MNRLRLIVHNTTHYWKAHLGAVIGTLFAAMALTGALIVGDCVDHTLRSSALKRLGNIEYVLSHPSRFIRERLAGALEESLSTTVAPVFQVKAIVRNGDGTLSANRVTLFGVDSRFWRLGKDPIDGFNDGEEAAIVNRALAERLSLRTGGQVVIRIENPSAISREIPLSTVDDSVLAFRLPVNTIAEDHQMGRFSLNANQIASYNIFVPLEFLQKKIEKPGKINMLLIGSPNSAELTTGQLDRALRTTWNLEDAQLQVRTLSQPGTYEIRTDRIFLESTLYQSVSKLYQPPSERPAGVLTYFVNAIRSGNHATPYSMVTAIQSTDSRHPEINNLLDHGIVITKWLADDLRAQKGNELTLTYNVLGPMRKLIERERTFTVHAVLPMTHPLCDPSLMPDFPGISKSEHCRDWDPGFIIDLEKIRDKDEDYWTEYKGTPKAFISLAAGREMWSNRYGDLTAIRFKDESSALPRIERTLAAGLSPQDFGLQFQPVRETALRAVDNAMSFGPLFVSLSFFLILSAVILTALLYVFGIERRARQTGIFFAVGFTQKTIRRLYLSEGIGIAVAGSALGVIAAMIYAPFMIWALSTVWSGAVAGIQFETIFSPVTLFTGFLSTVVISTAAIGYVIRRQSKSSIHGLLSVHSSHSESEIKTNRTSLWVAIAAVLFALPLFFLGSPGDAASASGQFFGIGALLLIAGIAACHAFLSRIMKEGNGQNLSLSELGKRNIGRRRGRSLAVIGALASGCFLMIAVGANRHDASYDSDSRTSGTGGFAFYCETTLPLLYDLNTEEGCNEFGLSRKDIPHLTSFPLRLRDGDDASCLNLNRAQNPKLMGINAERFSSRGAFRFVKTLDGNTSQETAWRLLDQVRDDGSIPAIIDQSTAMWALGKSIGDTLTYTDERGQPFTLCLVGFLSNSIFQGSVLISENHFIQRFPSSGGYRTILMDIPNDNRAAYKKVLNNALQDMGIEITPASARLAAFMEVENTYLSIFQILGGLGLILGCAGLSVVVMRNIYDRLSEFSLMRAMGFSHASIRRMIIIEHAYLLTLGLGCGSISGIITSLPALHFYTSSFPFFSLSLVLLLIVTSGIAGIYLSTVSALRANLLQSLRSE